FKKSFSIVVNWAKPNNSGGFNNSRDELALWFSFEYLALLQKGGFQD
ncbi:hypothetical protein NPIL_93261, partial [Nephila pilipes]